MKSKLACTSIPLMMILAKAFPVKSTKAYKSKKYIKDMPSKSSSSKNLEAPT